MFPSDGLSSGQFLSDKGRNWQQGHKKKRYGIHTVLSCLSESCSLAAKCVLTVPLFSYSGLYSKERKRALARINTAEYSIRPLQAYDIACCTGVHPGAYQQPGVFTSH